MDLSYAKGALIGLVVLAVTGAVGVAVVAGIQTTFAPAGGNLSLASAAYNITVNMVSAFTNFFALAPTLGTVLIAVVLLGAVAVLGYMGYQKANSME